MRSVQVSSTNQAHESHTCARDSRATRRAMSDTFLQSVLHNKTTDEKGFQASGQMLLSISIPTWGIYKTAKLRLSKNSLPPIMNQLRKFTVDVQKWDPIGGAVIYDHLLDPNQLKEIEQECAERLSPLFKMAQALESTMNQIKGHLEQNDCSTSGTAKQCLQNIRDSIDILGKAVSVEDPNTELNQEENRRYCVDALKYQLSNLTKSGAKTETQSVQTNLSVGGTTAILHIKRRVTLETNGMITNPEGKPVIKGKPAPLQLPALNDTVFQPIPKTCRSSINSADLLLGTDSDLGVPKTCRSSISSVDSLFSTASDSSVSLTSKNRSSDLGSVVQTITRRVRGLLGGMLTKQSTSTRRITDASDLHADVVGALLSMEDENSETPEEKPPRIPQQEFG